MSFLSLKPHWTFHLPRVLQKMRQGVESENMALGGRLVSLFGREGVLSHPPGSLSGSTAVGPGLALEAPCVCPHRDSQRHSEARPSRCLRTLADIPS